MSDVPLGSHRRTAEEESFGAAWCSYIITIIPRNESQEGEWFVVPCLSLVQSGIVDRHGSQILKPRDILEPAACFLPPSIRRVIFT